MPDKPPRLLLLVAVCASMSLACVAAGARQTSSDAIRYLARAIRASPVVCLAEGGHGSQTAHDFLKALLLDKDVQDAVDVIIVEFVTARYQARLDDYMNGKDVPPDELSKLWRDTTVSSLVQTWDSPLYHEFLQHLRAVNRSLAPGRTIRVMGGDPPIKWEEVRSQEDHRVFFRQRRSFPAGLAVQQALTHGKRVLIIFGGAHLAKVPGNVGGRIDKGLVNLIQERIPDGVRAYSFLIPKELDAEGRMGELERGKMYDTRHHWSGDLPAGLLFPMLFLPDGTRAEPYKGHKVKDLYDGLIYVGPLTEWVTASPAVYQDDEYWKELNRRSRVTRKQPMDEELRRK